MSRLGLSILPEVVSVSISPVPSLEAKSGVKVLVVEDNGEAAALVAHIVCFRVLVHRHQSNIGLGPNRSSGAAEPPGISLRVERYKVKMDTNI